MVSVWHGQGNYDLEFDNRKTPVFDYPYYVSFSELLNNDLKLRKTFLTPYHHVVIEESRVSFGAEINAVIKELRSYEEILDEDELPDFRLLVDQVKDLPFLFIKKSPAESLRTYLPDLTKDMLFKIQTMKPEDSQPLNKFFMSVAMNSSNLSELVDSLHKTKILQSSEVGFNYCNGCHRVSISNEKECFFCDSTNIDEFPMYHIPQPIMVEWINGGNKFLEAMTYHAIKTACPQLKDSVYCNLYLKKNHSFDAESEADVYIRKNNREGCVIMATTSPTQSQEKKQAKTFSELGFKVILVTTDSSPRELENHLDQSFLNVRYDQEFPANLISYLKEQQIIV